MLILTIDNYFLLQHIHINRLKIRVSALSIFIVDICKVIIHSKFLFVDDINIFAVNSLDACTQLLSDIYSTSGWLTANLTTLKIGKTEP